MNKLKWLLFAVYAIACVVAYPQLPTRIPYHFNFAGEPNAWGGVFLAWFGLPVVALIMILLLSWIMRFTPRAPHLWNVPEKKRFLALTDDQRAPIYLELAKLMDITAIGTTILMAAVQYGMYAVATNRRETLPGFITWATIIFVAGILVAALVFNAKVKRLILGAADDS